jgi:hypothetical protein
MRGDTLTIYRQLLMCIHTWRRQVGCVVHVSAPRPSALRIIQRPRTSFSFSGKPQQQTTNPTNTAFWTSDLGLGVRDWRLEGKGEWQFCRLGGDVTKRLLVLF